jgi:hypothetical protein
VEKFYFVKDGINKMGSEVFEVRILIFYLKIISSFKNIKDV